MSTKTKPEAAQTVKSESKLPPVPESVLKRRKRATDKAAALKQRVGKFKVAKKTNRRTVFKKAEKYVKEYRALEQQTIRLKRLARQHNNYYVPPEPKLALVIRIRGINQLHPKPRKILQLLRLRQINNATFVKLTGATSAMLRLVEPYVTYGYPNLKTVQQLVYKRGFARVHSQRVPITSNAVIQQHLGKLGIVCMEDLVHEIYTVGPHFKEASHFMWHFKLNPPRGGWSKVTSGYNEGGDFGNREDAINKLVRSMI